MQKIVPHLWFDKQAKEAAEFYVSIFPNSSITSSRTIHNTPSGDCDVMGFNLSGYNFAAISAGPYFKANPSISFMINFDPSRDRSAEENFKTLWDKLMGGGTALMPLQQYPFSKLYGWVQDKFGISWQLILTNPAGEERPFIIPSLLFTGKQYGKVDEAEKLYTSIFNNAKIGAVARYGENAAPDQPGKVMFSDFMLEGQWFAAMESAHEHKFAFNEGISFIVNCATQEEIDHYWKLSAVPEAEQCGWLKDQFGVSWQVVPTEMGAMMESGDPEKTNRVTQAFLKMKKFDVATLKKAYDGE